MALYKTFLVYLQYNKKCSYMYLPVLLLGKFGGELLTIGVKGSSTIKYFELRFSITSC